jgi:hypothetical protein
VLKFILLQPRPIKHAGIGFGAAPGGPGLAGAPGVGPARGTLGGPAVCDSGPLPGPDRRVPKQANISSLTGLYTASQSAPPRALRHGLHLSTPDGGSGQPEICDGPGSTRSLRLDSESEGRDHEGPGHAEIGF